MSIPTPLQPTDVPATRALRRAFATLAATTDYDSITVSAVCAEARLNRKTFYRYFANIEDLLTHIKASLVAEYLERVEGTRIPEDLRVIAREFFLFSAEKGPAYDRIIVADPGGPVRREFIHQVMAERWRGAPAFAHLSDDEQSVVISFAISTGIDVYRKWVRLGRSIDVERMIELYQAMLIGGIEAVLR